MQLEMMFEFPDPPVPKTYQPNAPCLRELFEVRGAFLDWHKLFWAFSNFLSQKSRDPKLQKAQDFIWEGRVIKVAAYHYREFEGKFAIYEAWCSLEEHLKGWTTDWFDNAEFEKDFITERIDGWSDA